MNVPLVNECKTGHLQALRSTPKPVVDANIQREFSCVGENFLSPTFLVVHALHLDLRAINAEMLPVQIRRSGGMRPSCSRGNRSRRMEVGTVGYRSARS
ncbi:hypothetical protein AVEN_4303-1 [Araneus ventricosus]|uniref:Uncharacterized protein n=1 Tax=Araneus ventricosus TaxID=182803 RepID=A0A4Y2PXB8_ARAVE|nr:hypothetical protein AVEN_4303-1 [Araneus ventricosus]